MVTQFQVSTKGTCGIAITDVSEYASSSTLSSVGYTFLLTCTLNVLRRIVSDDESTIITSDLQEHYIAEDGTTPVTDESDLNFGEDGLYEIIHIILPNLDWYNLYKDDSALSTTFTNGVYVSDGTNFYKLTDGELTEVTLEQLVEVNTTSTTINSSIKNTFSICNLKNCYFNISKKLLNEICPLSCSKSTYEEDEFNRDLIWMAINTIKYCLDLGQYYEASRILDQIIGCGNICPQYDSSTSTGGNSCGCSK